MMNECLSKVDAGPGREIRFEIERSPRLPAGRQAHVRVSMRLWTTLTGLTEKVPTGRGITLDGAQFGAFLTAARQAGQALESSSKAHE